MSTITLAFSPALDATDELADILERYDGLAAELDGGPSNSRKAQISRELLYAAHLTEKIKVSIDGELHRLKGRKQR